MPKLYFTIAFCVAFLAMTAVLVGWQVSVYPGWVWGGVGAIGVTALIFSFFRRHVSVLCICIVLGIAFSLLRISHTTHISTSDSIESFAVERNKAGDWPDVAEVTLRGIIVDEPDRRPLKTKYTIAVETPHAASLQKNNKILVTDHAMWPQHEYGDDVLVTGILEKPGQIEAFHYDRYLSRYGIYAVMYRATVETLSSGHGHRFFAFLYSLKRRFEAKLNRLYPEPHASFMAGLLTGSRRGIPEHLLKDFQATGLTHIIAISGYNISIVIAVISGFLFFVPIRWRIFPALGAIVFFTFFVGASPSVVRAAIMGGLGLFALQVGRQKHSLIAILVTAMLMTAWNPKILWYDAGFQLSFLSVLGLTYLAPLLDRFFRHVPSTLGLRESLQMTVSAQLAAVPLIIILFGQFSLVAPIANVIAAPFIPLAMLFGFLGTCAGFFSEPLGLLIAYPGWGALEVIIMATEYLSDFRYASVSTASVSHVWVWGYYVLLVAVTIGIQILSVRLSHSAEKSATSAAGNAPRRSAHVL